MDRFAITVGVLPSGNPGSAERGDQDAQGNEVRAPHDVAHAVAFLSHQASSHGNDTIKPYAADYTRDARMLKVYGFSKVNKYARGRTRDLRVLRALEEMGLPDEIAGGSDPKLLEPYANIRAFRERCMERPAWKKTFDAYCERVEAG